MSTTGFSLTHYAEAQLLNVFRGIAPRVITSLTLALYTTAPTEAAGSGVEVSGGSYARQALTLGAPAANTSPTTGSTVANTNDILFPSPTADWGTIVAVQIFDDAGNALVYGTLAAPITILNGYPRLEIAIGQLIDLLD